MQDFLTFTSSLLSSVSSFLLSEPVCWFVGCFLLLFIVGIVKRICST